LEQADPRRVGPRRCGQARSGARERKESNTGHCFAAIDIKRFRPLEAFTAAMDDMLQALNDTPRADGQERVYTAGEPEAEIERQRRVHGIPVAHTLVRQCNDIARDLGVKPLA
jgi:L-2-hydroxycarboxylate dehydrogenase (NAD+)